MRALVLSTVFIVAGCSSTPPCQDEVGAFVMAQEFIKRSLVSPSTAEFPLITASGVSSDAINLPDGRCAFNVYIYVDAQNGFGAQVRQNFLLTLTPDPIQKGSWTLEDMSTI